MKSVWKDTDSAPRFNPQDRDINVRTLIIGGGAAGILCAFELHRRGEDYVLIEADTILNGTSGNSTAKITSGHGLIYSKITDLFDIGAAELYYKANERALEKYRALGAEHDCDFEEKPNFVYSTDSAKKIEDEIAVLEKIGADAKFCKNLPLPVSISGTVCLRRQAQFNPCKFFSGIARGLNIYENTRAEGFVGKCVYTNRGKINAENIIIAAHFPILNKHGAYFIKMYQHRSYVIALENGPDVNGMYVDNDEKGLSFRNYKNYLLICGGGHRTGKRGGAYRELFDFAKRHYPNCEIKYSWAAQDCMTLDGMPYIGRYSPNTDGLYVASGFNKWGYTSAMASSDILADMIQGKENEYEKLFSPNRTVLRKQLAVNAIESGINFLTPTLKRCPHMGCALKWNRAEHTWDCPCHGSRFTEAGELIEGPATGKLKK